MVHRYGAEKECLYAQRRLFVLVALWLVINMLFTQPVESVVGLVLMALGLPL